MRVRILLWAFLITVLSACGNRTESSENTVKVKEVIQVEKYTYLLVEGPKGEFWMAAPTMDASPGETYTYQGGMKMENFHSTELDRDFDEVLFVEGLFQPGETDMSSMGQGMPSMGGGMSPMDKETTPGSRVKAERASVDVGHTEGSVSIADLYARPGDYQGKVIRVTGEVTKFNPAIMDKNWVHLQDGTEFEGKFDLTATTSESFVVGDQVTLEGVLATDMDFGYGYAYEILLEKATGIK